jgi:hypothetical protein
MLHEAVFRIRWIRDLFTSGIRIRKKYLDPYYYIKDRREFQKKINILSILIIYYRTYFSMASIVQMSGSVIGLSDLEEICTYPEPVAIPVVSHQWCDLFYRLLHSYTRHIKGVVGGERYILLSAQE